MHTLPATQRGAFALRRFAHHLTGWKGDDARLRSAITRSLEGAGPGRRLAIAEANDLEPAEFFARYYRTGTPVVLRGLAKDWPAVRTWSPAWLAEHHGDVPLSVMDHDNAGGRFNVEDMPLRVFAAAIEAGDTKKYLRFGNLLHQVPELIHDFDTEALYRYRSPMRMGQNMGVFMGAKGTRTTLHAAPPDNLFAQVCGSKRWVLLSSKLDPVLRPVMARSTYYWSDFDPDAPDYERYPAARYCDWYDFELHPGDVLYNPPSTWHQVTNLTASIGVGFRWMSPMAARNNLSQFLLFFLAMNPPLWVVLRNKRNYARVLQAAESKTVDLLERGRG